MFCGVMACVCPSVKPRRLITGAPKPEVCPMRLPALLTCANWFQWNREWPPLISFTIRLFSTGVSVASSCSERRLVPMADAGVRSDPPV